MSGRRLVRATLLLTLGLSIAANIGHTILADSAVPVWLRMIGAVWWPLCVFLAVEIFFRVQLSGTVMHRVAQALVLAPSVVAAITSYEHMHFMLLAMGEKPFIAIIGPAAVDAFMIGCTLILLFTREMAALSDTAKQIRLDMVSTWMDAGQVDVDEVLQRHGITEQEMPIPVSPAVPAERILSAAEVGDQMAQTQEALLARLPVAKPAGNTAEKLQALLADPELKATTSTMRTYAKVARMLREDPQATIGPKVDGRSVRPELVEQIREWAQTGRAYV